MFQPRIVTQAAADFIHPAAAGCGGRSRIGASTMNAAPTARQRMFDLDFTLGAGLIAALFHLVLAPVAALHALMFKRDSRAAFGWIGLCVVLPVAGPVLYLVFGVNRIRRRAQKLDRTAPVVGFERGARASRRFDDESFEAIGTRLGADLVLPGNLVRALDNGDEAYPEMLEAIASANHSVFLSSYIFESNHTGRRFVEALAAARQRGADVRVLIDGIGQYYSRPRISRLLARAGISHALFLPPRLLPPRLSINLRNHHKILVVDRRIAFTGGMNIGDRHLVDQAPEGSAPVADIQFRLEGPIARTLQAAFLSSWEFATGEDRPAPRVETPTVGDTGARVLTDGPDEDLDRITLLLAALIARAREEILIMTPYFVPPRELIGALQAARLKGVRVRIVLPEKNNLPFVHWATRNMLWELLYQDVEIRYQPPPFSHAKLLVIDREYAQIGSANWDPRSLRLNFELQVELFDAAIAATLAGRIDAAAERGRPITLDEVDGRSLPVRLRDSICWLFSPYL